MIHKIYKIFGVMLVTIFLSCSPAHQIIFTIPHCWGVPKLPPTKIHLVSHSPVMISVKDSLLNYVSRATISGGLCKGHEFDLEIGKGVFDAFRSALLNFYDTVQIIYIHPDTLYSALGGTSDFTFEIKEIKANADFSPNGFSVNIKANLDFTIKYYGIVPLIQHPHTDVGQMQKLSDYIHIHSESSGKGEDCHDATLYLKKAGDMAMQNLCDSITKRLAPAFK